MKPRGGSDLLDRIVTAEVEALRGAPEDALRRVFDAFWLRVVYDGRTGMANCRVTITDDSLATIDTATPCGPDGGCRASGARIGCGRPAGSDGTTADRGDHGQRRADARGGCFPSELRPRSARSPIRTAR
jgi:hypothetical protein